LCCFIRFVGSHHGRVAPFNVLSYFLFVGRSYRSGCFFILCWGARRWGPRFNDIGVEFISVRLKALRIDLVTRCGLGNSGKSTEQTGVLSIISVFQGDFLSLTRARVVVGSGARFQIHSFPTENGSIPPNTENLLFSVSGATSALFTVLPLPLPLDRLFRTW